MMTNNMPAYVRTVRQNSKKLLQSPFRASLRGLVSQHTSTPFPTQHSRVHLVYNRKGQNTKRDRKEQRHGTRKNEH